MKFRAITAQVSQVGPMLEHFDAEFLRAGLAEESFRLAP